MIKDQPVSHTQHLEAVTRSNLIYDREDQGHFSQGIIKSRSVRERYKRKRGCLNIVLINGKSTLKQFFDFSLYLEISSIFTFKENSVSKIPDFQASCLLVCKTL